jgi:UDP-N-acetylmuramyl tripeptide synthase
MDAYLNAKAMLFKQTKKNGYSFLNSEDKYSKRIEEICNGKVMYYGKSMDADFRFDNVIINPKYTEFDLITKTDTYHIKSPLLGMFNVYNLTVALSVLITMGIDINRLDYSKLYVDGRMEDIDMNQDFKVIVDYAHTPNGYLNLFELTKTLNAKRTIIVAGSAGERDKTKRPLMGSILVNNADLVVFTYEDPRSEDPNDIIDDLTSEVLDKKDKFIRIVDREEAINYAINEAKTDDMVLILGKGNETYEALKDGKIYFNDVECAKKALEKRIKISRLILF